MSDTKNEVIFINNFQRYKTPAGRLMVIIYTGIENNEVTHYGVLDVYNEKLNNVKKDDLIELIKNNKLTRIQ